MDDLAKIASSTAVAVYPALPVPQSMVPVLKDVTIGILQTDARLI
jgi:hypothetical protein